MIVLTAAERYDARLAAERDAAIAKIADEDARVAAIAAREADQIRRAEAVTAALARAIKHAPVMTLVYGRVTVVIRWNSVDTTMMSAASAAAGFIADEASKFWRARCQAVRASASHDVRLLALDPDAFARAVHSASHYAVERGLVTVTITKTSSKRKRT